MVNRYPEILSAFFTAGRAFEDALAIATFFFFCVYAMRQLGSQKNSSNHMSRKLYD
jgi:hypothetical protein